MTGQQAFSQYDVQGSFLGLQSAKGTAATALSTALGPTKVTAGVDKEEVKGEPLLGQGFNVGRSLPIAFSIAHTMECITTLDKLPSMLYLPFCDMTTVDNGDGTFTHTFRPKSYNADVPYFTRAEIYGATGASLGSGLVSEISRDNRITSLKQSVSAKDRVRSTVGFGALNQGHGAVGTTYALDTSYNEPVPNNAAGSVMTYPAWFPTSLCPTNIEIDWNPSATKAGPCIGGGGEYADTLITMTEMPVTLTFIWDANAEQVYNWINYGTNTGSALQNTSSLVTAFKEGALSFKFSSTTLIGATTVPNSITWNFPSLQWKSAKRNSGQSPITMDVAAHVFGADWSIAVTNDKSHTQMGL